MPLSEALTPEEDISSITSPDDSLAVDDTLANDPQVDSDLKDYMQPADVPTPSAKGAKFIQYNPDGSALFDSGGQKIKYFRNDGHIEWEQGDKTFASKSPLLKPTVISVKKQPKHQLADFTGPDGKPYKAMVDMDTGDVVKKYDDPSSRAGAQAETLRVRILNSAKTQPGIVAYVNVKNNYDSLLQNAEIPDEQRTAADDAAAIQAFGAIEHPGTGVTDSDKKQAAALVPLWSSIGLKIKNVTSNKSNTLTGDTVRQMRDAAKRALDGRQKTYNDELAPIIKEAQRVGLSPEEVNGALGASVVDPLASKPTPQPSSTPLNTPDAAAIKEAYRSGKMTREQARAALESLGQ